MNLRWVFFGNTFEENALKRPIDYSLEYFKDAISENNFT